MNVYPRNCTSVTRTLARAVKLNCDADALEKQGLLARADTLREQSVQLTTDALR